MRWWPYGALKVFHREWDKKRNDVNFSKDSYAVATGAKLSKAKLGRQLTKSLISGLLDMYCFFSEVDL
jgi:hypothetical protein